MLSERSATSYAKQDMNRYASPILKVAFDGPDVKDEAIYDLLRVSRGA